VVRDATGAVVPQATVSARNTETGQTRITETGINGNYNLPSLPVGPYEMTVEKPGFRQLVRSGITLSVGQEAVLNLTLEIGQVQQTVEVTGEAPLVNTTLASTSGLITGDQVKDLPLNGRSFHQLMTLNAHTVDNRSNSGAGQASFSVAGKRTENNRWTINGVDYVGDNATGQFIAPSGISGQLLGVEAVREFNVLGHSYGAEYGKRSGGQVTAVTTSGTNMLHGTAFEFLRNNRLDARNYFDFEDRDGDGQADNAPLKRNQFGGSLGGPIIRDKMFVFGNYEGYRQRVGDSTNVFVPSAQVRQGLLPCNVVYSGAARTANCGTSLAGLNAYVPVPNLARGMLPYAEHFWPLPNQPEQPDANGLLTGIARYSSNPVQRTEEDFGLARFDYNISSADSLMTNFTADQGRESDPENNPIFRGATTRNLYTLSVQETHIFSPTILNVATFGQTRARATDRSNPINPIPENLVFLRGPNRNSPGAFAIGGGASTAQVSSIVSPNPQNLFYNSRSFYSGSDDLRITRGLHNLAMGVWFQKVQQIAFSSAQNNAGTAAYPSLLAFLTDQPQQFQYQANPTELDYRSTEAAWYFQDELKLRPNLTVRLGLRYEMTTGWNQPDGNAANYAFDQNGVIISTPFIGRSALQENNALALWQPRVGVAWDPTGAGKWAVRAGFGIHHDLQDNLTHRLNAVPPFAGRAVVENTPLLSLIPVSATTAAPPPCTGQGIPAGCIVYAPGGIDPILHTPTIQEWSLEIQREITQDLAVELSYIGSQSYHVATQVDMNSIQPLRCENPAGCLSGGTRPARLRVTVPQGTEYIPAGATRPNPFVGSTLHWMYLGTSSHHGASVSLNKRSRGGLMFRTNYTFAKVMDIDSAILATSGQNDTPTVLNRFNLDLSKGVASYSLAHAFSGSFSYELPFGNGKAFGSGASGWVEKVIGGWQWNGTLSAQGGFPITMTAGSNHSGNGDARNPDVPSRNPAFQGKVIRGVDGFKKTGVYFDPNAFLPLCNPAASVTTNCLAAGTFGNVARGAFRGPGLFNMDTSLLKRIPLNERFNMQFRAEFFNILNHANFDTPNPLVFTGTDLNATAGEIIETSNRERLIQFGLKLQF
jgi:hypothetical protein